MLDGSLVAIWYSHSVSTPCIMNREAQIVQRERRAKRIRVRRIVPYDKAAVLEVSGTKSKQSTSDMVFPHTKFPSSFEKSSLHISAMEGDDSLSLLKDYSKPGMKRVSQSEQSVFCAEKRKRTQSPTIFMKEEISEADFQMKLIKQSLALKKDWVYQQVLEKLGVTPPGPEYLRRKTSSMVNRTKDDRLISLHGRNSLFTGDENKVHDEEGNCYIDEDDYKSFYRPSERNKDELSGSCYDKYTASKRNLTFTYHGNNGGVALDHTSLPKVMGIHSVCSKHSNNVQNSRPKHVSATVVGSMYTTSPVRKCPVREDKWWPPSPESIPDEISPHEGDGLLKVMTPEDMKAYGLPKQENQRPSEDDEVFVTQVVRRSYESSPKVDIHGLPPVQLDADGKPSNYKEILLHYIAQQVKNNPHNPSITRLTNTAITGQQKTMNMDELCKKLLNMREKLEKEEMKWKRKLLASLEVVLIKKIRKLEQEGETVPQGIDLDQPIKYEQSGSSESQNEIMTVVEDLTRDITKPPERKISEATTTHQTVSVIRGYDSS